MPIAHSCVGLQRVPHAPQFDGSVWRLKQLPEQTVWPMMQSEQCVKPPDVEHRMPDGHAFPQAPQLLRSVVRFTQPMPGQYD